MKIYDDDPRNSHVGCIKRRVMWLNNNADTEWSRRELSALTWALEILLNNGFDDRDSVELSSGSGGV